MEVFEALRDPIRRRILELLSSGAHTAGDLGRAFRISRPAVSRHLRVLRQSGLVRAEARGRHRVYALDPQGFAEVSSWLDRYRRFFQAQLDEAERRAGPAQARRQGAPRD